MNFQTRTALAVMLAILLVGAIPASATIITPLKTTPTNLYFLQVKCQNNWVQMSIPTWYLLKYDATQLKYFDVADKQPIVYGTIAGQSITGVKVNEVTGRPAKQPELDGQCVSFAKAVSKSTYTTANWTKGTKVMSNTGSIPVGTIIAAFGTDYTIYSNIPLSKKHVAVYAGPAYDKNRNVIGINVWDQNYVDSSRHLVGFHQIKTTSTNQRDNANGYYVVNVPAKTLYI